MFTEPLPLTEILASFDAMTPIGSAMRTKEWEQAPQALRDSAFFSAAVTEAGFLDGQQKAIRQIIDRARGVNEKGESYWAMDRSRFVVEMKKLGEQLGVHRPGGRTDGVKDADITDPLSAARLRLVVNTQLEMAYGEGQWRSGMDEDMLNEWPAWELVRLQIKRLPRDWIIRWKEAGGTLHDGRMIALKTDGIWLALSRFGKPHPPFDYNSGMGFDEIDRDEAEALAVVKPGQRISSNVRDHERELKASVKGLGEQAKRWLLDHSRGRIKLAADGESVMWEDKPERRF